MSEWSGARPEALRRVALHGFLGCGADWGRLGLRDAWCPDLPGHGDTPLDRAPSMEGWADALAAQLDGPVDVIGYSMGGRLALSLAARHPSRVRRLLLVSTSLGIEDPEARAARLALDEERAAALRLAAGAHAAGDADPWRAWLRSWLSAPLFASIDVEAAVARRAARSPKCMAHVIAALSPGRAPSRHAWSRTWPRPALWIAGEHDTRYARAARENATAMPAGDATIVPACGHALLEQAPLALGVLAHRTTETDLASSS